MFSGGRVNLDYEPEDEAVTEDVGGGSTGVAVPLGFSSHYGRDNASA